MNEWTIERMNEWMDEWLKERMNGWMNEWTNESAHDTNLNWMENLQSIKSSFIDYTFDKNAEGLQEQEYEHEKHN